MEQAMLQIKTNSSAPTLASRHRTFVAALDQVMPYLRAQAAHILRLLILVLVGLLFLLVGLMILTGRVEIGGPIMGSVLLIGFGAAQFGRLAE
jgi:hypothetical protein